MQHSAIRQCSVAQCSAVQNISVQCSAVQCSALQCNAQHWVSLLSQQILCWLLSDRCQYKLWRRWALAKAVAIHDNLEYCSLTDLGKKILLNLLDFYHSYDRMFFFYWFRKVCPIDSERGVGQVFPRKFCIWPISWRILWFFEIINCRRQYKSNDISHWIRLIQRCLASI